MPSDPVSTLSELAEKSGTRRDFLIKSSLLGTLAPLALGCGADDTESNRSGVAAGTAQGGPATAIENPNSRLDPAGRANVHQSTAVLPDDAVKNLAFRRYDPALPPVAAERNLKVQFTALEVPLKVAPDITVSAWTFDGDIPGPILHVRQGDTVEFTLLNRGALPHSMDFHAAQIDPKIAFRSASPGQSVSFTFRARFPGAYMYHCGTSPVLMHIGSGMVGAIIVDPPSPLPTAKEFVLVQSEYYVPTQVDHDRLWPPGDLTN